MVNDWSFARYDLGSCNLVEPQFVGIPGSRTFRLYVQGETKSALLWLEKEELYELALTIKQLLRAPIRETGEPAYSADQNQYVDIEQKINGLSLGVDKETGSYMILASFSGSLEDSVLMWLEPNILNWLADRAFEIHGAGRSRCPLCHSLMSNDKDHACPRYN
ncbi:MAG: DUF3090 family protein [SAR202 cluster bacterium]|nr:DUF3090 family protein [SAR202 cluster bacterium]|tara:strand:- start:1715 stop:2203 length:489 start_codon:yes stop_codon:yes gene_type:complete